MNPIKNHAIKIASLLLCISVFSISLPAATNAEAPTPKAVTPAAPPLVKHFGNSHLHGVVHDGVVHAVTKAAGAATLPPKKITGKAKARVTRWSFSEWAEVHRGLGTIRGEVHRPNGTLASGIRVTLRGSKGKVLKASSRHVTHTNGAGSFVMKHVRIGSYRVRATKGKESGHVGVKVHGGQMASASVKI